MRSISDKTKIGFYRQCQSSFLLYSISHLIVPKVFGRIYILKTVLMERFWLIFVSLPHTRFTWEEGSWIKTLPASNCPWACMHSKIDAEGPGPLWAVIGKQAEGGSHEASKLQIPVAVPTYRLLSCVPALAALRGRLWPEHQRNPLHLVFGQFFITAGWKRKRT